MPGDEQLVRIAGRRLRVTNLSKVLYPATGTTKGEVIEYYTRIAPLLIPHIIGRPLTRKRWVDGVGTPDAPGEVFFAKDLEAGAPSWVQRRAIEHSGGPKYYPVADDVATLAYLAQVASLELHVPQWRFSADGQRADADRIVLDLDPGEGAGLVECAIVAQWLREVLTGMGLDPFPVTSGSKGLHVYAALPLGHSSEQASTLARELAHMLEADHPDLVVSTQRKTERSGRVLVDWSQNSAAKTTIAPYSLRGRFEPTCAAPRSWDEISSDGLRQLRFDEVLERAERVGDPMAELGFHAAGRSSHDGPLASYIAKRTAGATPEPVPSNALGAAPAERPRFVIQEHHASRLHWDLRLEHDGVLVSWAVPRGIPHTTSRNSLAVMTEDHPLEYAEFEGTIPAGAYGAGTMTIWDAGHIELEKWRDDEVIFTAHGRPGGPLGTVRLALIRTEGSGEKSSWLLHRMKTDAAGRSQPDVEPVVPRTSPPPPEPVASDTSTAAGRERAPRVVDGAPPRPGRLRPMLAGAATAGLARSAAQRWSRSSDTPPWAEMKWDGIRAIGVWDGGRLGLRARSGNDITATYPELSDTDVGFGPVEVVVDGEIVALDDDGRPSFALLQRRMNLTRPSEIAAEARRIPVRYHLFDLLEVDGRDATGLPLTQRREVLEALAGDLDPPIVLPPVFDDVDTALETSRELDLEGIMVKDPASVYRSGERSERWLKVKFTRMQEVVVGAIRPGRGGRSGTIGSLLVGVPTAQGLRYAGRVGTGFTDTMLRNLGDLLGPLRTDHSPFLEVPPADAADALWVRPELVGEVEFGEWTPGGILRHARWRGLRPDKSPTDVTVES